MFICTIMLQTMLVVSLYCISSLVVRIRFTNIQFLQPEGSFHTQPNSNLHVFIILYLILDCISEITHILTPTIPGRREHNAFVLPYSPRLWHCPER